MSHGRGTWIIIERSGRFWMVIQGKEKRKKIKEVRHLLERVHDKSGFPESAVRVRGTLVSLESMGISVMEKRESDGISHWGVS